MALPFPPSPSASASPNLTLINGVPLSLTALTGYNYALYPNHTLSNTSHCYLAFAAFRPVLLANGTWLNATTCYVPYYGIRSRGAASIAFAVAFAASIICSLVNLYKHGRLWVREDKRFRVVGRRWQWYWMLFVAGCGMVSTLTGVDVDRYYLQQMPVVLQGFFFSLMVPGVLGVVWEAVRHWGSWQERQLVDAEPHGLRPDSRRAKTEFYLPLVFYLFAWLVFFATIPRSWTPLQKQNSPYQIDYIARPAATNARTKAGALLAVPAYATIVFSLAHSLRHYHPRSALRSCPPKLGLAIALLGARVAYGIAAAWDWDLSVFRADVALGWPFGVGYGAILAVMVVLEVYGFLEENEDKVLIGQRVKRGRAQDAELGIRKRPEWWSGRGADRYRSEEERMRGLMGEVSDKRAPKKGSEGVTGAVEMGEMGMRMRSRSRPVQDPFRDESPSRERDRSTGQGSGLQNEHGGVGEQGHGASVETGATLVEDGRRGGTGNGVGEARQQRIRSMLDV